MENDHDSVQVSEQENQRTSTGGNVDTLWTGHLYKMVENSTHFQNFQNGGENTSAGKITIMNTW